MHWLENMHDKIILTDIDGVCLNWEAHFHFWMEQRGYKKVSTGIYSITDNYDIVRDRAEQLLNEFNTSAYMIAVPPLNDAVSGISTLFNAGYRFIGITSIGIDPYTSILRKINLDEVFGKDVFLEVHCVSEDKRPILSRFKDSKLYWIEDLPSNALLGLELGLTPILMTHEYNKWFTNPKVRRVNNWQDITKIMIDNLGS